MNSTDTQTAPFREDRQFGEPYADNEQVYRTIGLTSAQLQRLPQWAQLAFARADASLIRRDEINADLLELVRSFESMCPSAEGLGGHSPWRAFQIWANKAREAIAKA